MSKKNFFILSLTMFIIALTVTVLVACDNATCKKDIVCEFPPEDGTETYEFAVDELPPESFVGTVAEEDTTFMVVAPNKDEDEYYRYGKYIRVEYLRDHVDYLYGIGRKVVITYIPPVTAKPTITTDDIRHDGFEEFELSVQYKDDSIPAHFLDNQPQGLLTLVANNRDFDEYASDYNLYYYGLHDVYVTVDGNTLPLKEALNYGKVTIDGIVADCNRRAAIGEIDEYRYKDGGSVVFDFGDYKIIKYHTLDGNRDIYIGTNDMDINAKNATAVYIGAYLWKDWGLRLEARDVSFDGATIVFDPFEADVTGRLQTGDAFWLEKMDGGKWVAVDTLPLIDYAFNMVAYGIDSDGETEFPTDWHWLYGALGGGRYRIAKEVMDFRGTGDFDEQIYYAYFEKPYLTDYLGTDCISIDGFSYEEDLKKYENSDAIVKTSDFINTGTTLWAGTDDIYVPNVSNMDVIIELAMRELGIEDYKSYSIYYWVDENYFQDNRVMYKISFEEDSWYTFSEDGIVTSEGTKTQTVYIDDRGKTHLVISHDNVTIDSENQAIAVAEEVLYEVYGETINDEKPLKATYNESEGTWLVKGTMQELKHGGVAEITISTDGKILNITHGK